MPLEDIVRGALVGIAVGGFVAGVVEANIFALETLLRFNFIAVEAVGCMLKGCADDLTDRQKLRRQQYRQRRQLWLDENEQRKQMWLAENEQQRQRLLVEKEEEEEEEEKEETESETETES